jgi:mitogen-activated protein kinase kinase
MSTPSRPLRTKRNFKELQLPTGPSLSLPPPPNPAPALPQPPPPPDAAATVTAATKPRDAPLLPVPPSSDPSASSPRSAVRASITRTIAGFSNNSLDLQNEKLAHIREIGQGNGGSVSLVRHRDTQFVMAKKAGVIPPVEPLRLIYSQSQIVLIDAKPSVRKQIVRELQIMHECNSRYIIDCYGSYLSDPNICICMEYMDRGSFDRIYKKIGPIQVPVVARVAMSVLQGLTYLYDVHRIIHRGSHQPFSFLRSVIMFFF